MRFFESSVAMPTLSSDDLGLVIKAIAFAAHKHRNQRRKDAPASPYINHPIALAELLTKEAGINEVPVIVAALLHDTLEDTETTLDELTREFGREIADVVAEVSDNKSLPKAERKRLQVSHAPTLSHRAKLVKLADKICNLRDILASPPVGWSLSRRREYFEWAGEVVAGLRGTNDTLEKIFLDIQAKRPDDESPNSHESPLVSP